VIQENKVEDERYLVPMQTGKICLSIEMILFRNRKHSSEGEGGGGAVHVRTKIYKPLHLVSADFSCFLLLLVRVIIH
jgi:hypothetical protein